MESICVKKVKVEKNRLDIYFEPSKEIQKYFLPENHFFAEFDFDISDVPKSVLIVPFLTNVLQMSWLTDSVVWVDEIDEDFYNQIQPLKTAFRELHPNVDFRGTLIAARRVKHETFEKKEALQLFTGGVDATTSLIRNIEKKPILFNTNGWYTNDPNERNPVYDADVKAISKIAEENGVEAKFVKSNFAKFIKANVVDSKFGKSSGSNWWFGFQHSLAFLGCAMVAAYRFNVKTVYIASSYTFGQHVVCVSDPRIDNCIKCAGINTIHDGYELSRQDKVREIVSFQKNSNRKIALRVCSFNTKNCCNCEKCFRSMLALIAEGADDLSKFGFELDDTVLNELKAFIEKQAMELDHAHVVFWNDVIGRMGDNYKNLAYPEVYDYLSEIDLNKARKQAILNHYRHDYKDIIKRKLRRIFRLK